VLDASKNSAGGLTRFEGGDDEGAVISSSVDQSELSLLQWEDEREATVFLLLERMISKRLCKIRSSLGSPCVGRAW
jgi:hypothetical protein